MILKPVGTFELRIPAQDYELWSYPGALIANLKGTLAEFSFGESAVERLQSETH